MKTLEVISAILAGGIFLTWLLYLAVRCLGNARDNKDRADRMEESTYYGAANERYQYPKE